MTDSKRAVENIPVVWCPIGKERACMDAMGLRKVDVCAWWIPNEKACAIVQIARKLSALSRTLFEQGGPGPPRSGDIPF